MRKSLRIAVTVAGALALMVACGSLAFVAAITFFMNLGLKLHGNYEYYGGTPALVFIFGFSVIGFLAPGGIIWYLHKHSWRISLRTLLIAMTIVAAILGSYAMSL